VAAIPFETIDRQLLQTMFDLEEKLVATGSVDKVISPLSILKEAFGLTARADMEVWLQSDDRIANFRRRLEQFTILHDTVLSFRTKTVGMVLNISSRVADTDTEKIFALKHLIERHPGFRGPVVVTGALELMRVLHGYTAFSQKVFTPACLVVITLVLLVLYRSAFGVIVPLAAVLAPLIWTKGIFNLVEQSTNFITTMIPPLILGVGMTSCIHLVTAYFHRSRDADEFSMDLLVETLRDQARPIVMCQVTTLFGFATLAANGIGAVRQYGLYCGMGVLFVLVTVFLLIPSLVILRRVTKQRVTSLQQAPVLFAALARFVLRRRWFIIAAAALMSVIGVAGLSRISIETSLLRYLPRHHRAIGEVEEVERRLCGVVPVHLCLQRDGVDLDHSLLDPVVCRAVAKLQNQLVAIPDVDAAMSYVSLVQDYDRVFSDEPDHIPPSAEEVEEYLDFYRPAQPTEIVTEPIVDASGAVTDVRVIEVEPTDKGAYSAVDWFISRDYRRAHIGMRIRDVTSREFSAIFRRVDDLTGAEGLFPPDVRTFLTGRAELWVLTSEILVRNQLTNFLLALIIICLVIVVQFRSLVVGVVALLPNVLPILFLYGLMGFGELPLNTVTAMIACVAIGMVVDDTIHYLHAYRKHVTAGLPAEEAIVEAMLEKGSSMVFTTVVMIAGFAVLTLSEFPPTYQFGALISATFLLALLLDLLLTPALMVVLRPFGSPPVGPRGTVGPSAPERSRSPMKRFHLHAATHPCTENAMNLNLLRRWFQGNGWLDETDPTRADVVVVCTCGFSQAQEDEEIGLIERLEATKRPDAERVVLGCLPRINARRHARVFTGHSVITDRVGDFDDLFALPKPIAEFHNHFVSHDEYATDPKMSRFFRFRRFCERFDWLPLVRVPRVFLTVPSERWWCIRCSMGCTQDCSYCRTKHAAFPFKSEPVDSVLAQVREGVAAGFAEIALTGEDLGGYGTDIGSSLDELLRAILDVPGDFCVNLRYIDPVWLIALHEQLMPVFATGRIRAFCAPIQSGSDRVLSLMNRPYGFEAVKRVVNEVVRTTPVGLISTNLIVGFPTETEDDVEATLRVVSEIDFGMYQVHRYEEHQDSASAALAPKIPADEIERRFRRVYRAAVRKHARKLFLW